MQLRSPQLEKAVRQGIKKVIRSDPRLRAEARKENRKAGSRVNAWLQYVGSQYVGILVWGFLAEKADIRMALAALAFWGLGSVATHAARFRQTLYGNQDLAVLFHQPLTDDDVFSVQWTKFIRRSLAASSGIVIPIAVFALMRLNTWQDQVVLILMAPLWLAMTILLAVHLEAFSTRGWHRFLSGCFLIAIGLLIPAPEWNSIQKAIVATAWWLPPFGWFNYAFYYGVIQREWLSLSLFLPAFAFVVWLPFSLRKLRSNYHLGEPEHAPGEDLDLGLDADPQGVSASGTASGTGSGSGSDSVAATSTSTSTSPGATTPAANANANANSNPESSEEEAEEEDSDTTDEAGQTEPRVRSRPRPRPRRAGATAVEEFLLSRGYMRVSPWWSMGWMERVAMRWFTPQQRLTAAFLGMPSEAFSKSAKTSLIITLIGMLAMMFLGQFSYALAALIAFTVLVRVSGIHTNYWPGLGTDGLGGIHPPLHAGYPLSLPTMAGVILKANSCHTLLTVPMLALIGAIGTWRMGDSPIEGASMGMKIGLFVLFLQPAFTAFHLANRVRWNRRPKWVAVPAFLLLGLLLIACSVLGVLYPEWMAFLLVSVGATLAAYAMLGLVILGWKRGWYDLLLIPPTENG